MELPLRTSMVTAIALLLISITTVVSQTDNAAKGYPLLEIVSTTCSTKDCDLDTTRVYADGRYVRETRGQEAAKSGRYRSVSLREEKLLEPEEVSELVSWAEQADFLGAESEYVVTTIDSREEIAITYRYNGREKKVRVANYSRGNAAQKSRVPISILRLARWAQPNSFSN